MASTGAAAVTGDAKNVWQTKCDRRDEFNCIQLWVGISAGSARVVTVSRYKLIFPLLVPAGHRSPDSYHRSNPSQAELLFHCWASLSACPQLSLAQLNGRAPPSTRLSTFSVIGNICPSPSHISAEEFQNLPSFNFYLDFAIFINILPRRMSSSQISNQAETLVSEFQLSVFNFPAFKLWCWLSMMPAIENCDLSSIRNKLVMVRDALKLINQEEEKLMKIFFCTCLFVCLSPRVTIWGSVEKWTKQNSGKSFQISV